jgi:hypothetical protein
MIFPFFPHFITIIDIESDIWSIVDEDKYIFNVERINDKIILKDIDNLYSNYLKDFLEQINEDVYVYRNVIEPHERYKKFLSRSSYIKSYNDDYVILNYKYKDYINYTFDEHIKINGTDIKNIPNRYNKIEFKRYVIFKQIDELVNLPDNWDGYGGIPVLEPVAILAKSFLFKLNERHIDYLADCYPNPYGTLDLHFGSSDKFIKIEFGISTCTYLVYYNSEYYGKDKINVENNYIYIIEQIEKII